MDINSDNIEEKLVKLIDASISIASEKDIDSLLEKLLKTAKKIARADGGTLYIIGEDRKLHYNIILNDSLDIYVGGNSGRVIGQPPIPVLDEKTETFNKNNAASYAVINRETLNIPDVYSITKFDFKGVRKFDKENKYISKSFLIVPLKNRSGKVIAVIQLINSLDTQGNIVPFDGFTQKVVEALASQATVMLEYQRLLTKQKKFIEAFVEIMADAIEKQSPYVSAHCQRVPIITKKLATAATIVNTGPLKDFELSEDQWYALHIASWLHDCGKLIIPGHVLGKSTKLESVYNRIHEIRTRFEVLKRDLHIDYLRKRLEGKENPEVLLDDYNGKLATLQNDFEIVARSNLGEERLSEIEKKRLKVIAEYKFKRNFDVMLGLAHEEASLYPDNEKKIPAEEHVLADTFHHIQGRYNHGELYNLLTEMGTLNTEERQIINEHVEFGAEIIQKIPFPDNIKGNIFDYAVNHHERLDGSGYPRGIKAADISIPARIIAIADTFEALTASDRSYRVPKKLSQVLEIMNESRNKGEIDSDLFDLFLESGAALEYAEEYMRKDQIDITDFSKYIKGDN